MRRTRTSLRALAFWGLLAAFLAVAWPAAAELRLPTLTTKRGTYTNVVITAKTERDIYIRHDGGIGNIKLADIEDDDALVALGLKAPPVKVEVTESATGETIVSTNAPTKTESQVAQYQAQIMEKLKELQRNQPKLDLKNGLAALGIFLVIHLFFSFCLKLICVKAGYKPGVVVWLPLLQVISALRAASMSLLWLVPSVFFLLSLVALPLVAGSGSSNTTAIVFIVFFGWAVVTAVINCLAQIIWCFKITSARGKSIFMAILLRLPVTNLFAFLYLAFSSSGGD